MVRCVSVSVLWSGELQGLVPQRLLQVFRHQPQPGGLWSSLLLLCATTEPGQNQNYVLLITSIHKEKGHKHFSADGAEHHVWLRDAAAGGAFGPSGRLHHRLPGENRLMGQKQPAAGRRADRRPAAARGKDGKSNNISTDFRTSVNSYIWS